MYHFSCKQKLVLSLLLCFGLGRAMAIDQLYINTGSVTTPPQIDAYGFLNDGTFNLSTSLPFETSDTLYYTNHGTMTGSIGWRFNNATTRGRFRSANFLNEGSINSTEDFIVFTGNFSSLSYLFVSATNVTCPGTMTVGASGLMRIDGANINMHGAGLLAGNTVSGQTGFLTGSLDSVTQTNFFNENNVVDLYWGVGTNNAFKGGSPLDLASGQFDTSSFNFGSGSHEVVDQYDFTNIVQVPSQFFFFTAGGLVFSNFTSGNFKAFAFTNRVNATSQVVQVAFVSGFTDTNMNIDVRFAPNFRNQATRNLGSQAIVQISVPDTDVLTGLPFTNVLYFSDNTMLAAQTNLFLQQNFNVSTLRPSAFDVTLATPFQWFNGAVTNTTYSPSLLYNQSYLNNEVTNVYSAYSVAVGPAASTATTGIGGFNSDPALLDPTNAAGRIEIIGGRVDLNESRIRSQGLLTIVADNFQDLTNGVKMDAQQLSLNLVSTNQTFVISNLLSTQVRRLNGQLNAYSTYWTNQTATNNDIFQVLILENLLTPLQPSTSYGFTVRATNQPGSTIVLVDPIVVGRDFLVDAENVWIKSSVDLFTDISAANLPRTLNFTNDGNLFVNNATFSRANGGPYLNFVNHSNIFTAGATVNASNFVNSGTFQASAGSLVVSNVAGASDLRGGFITLQNNFIDLSDRLSFSNSLISVGNTVTDIFTGQITYNVGSITISGNSINETGTNIWNCWGGAQFLKASVGQWTGDLLQTTLNSTAKPFGIIQHRWSGTDYGPVFNGYTNNAALGHLVLDSSASPQFRFSGPSPTVTNAIYVDYLELKNAATNYATSIIVDPNFRIYFAAANIPAEKLNGIQNGRVIWMSSYAGAHSSTNITLRNGQTITTNIALVTATGLDSDGDGVPNAIDPFPFDGLQVNGTNKLDKQNQQMISISWFADSALWQYNVDYSTNLINWTTFATIVSPSTPGQQLVTQDYVSSGIRRFYRVRTPSH